MKKILAFQIKLTSCANLYINNSTSLKKTLGPDWSVYFQPMRFPEIKIGLIFSNLYTISKESVNFVFCEIPFHFLSAYIFGMNAFFNAYIFSIKIGII